MMSKIKLIFLCLYFSQGIIASKFEVKKQYGLKYFQNKKYKNAIKSFASAYKLFNNDIVLIDKYTEAMAYDLLGDIQINRANNLVKKKQFRQAIPLIDEAEKINPFHKKIPELRDIIQENINKKGNPFKEIDIAILEKYNKFMALARNDESLEKYTKALDYYSKALSLVPKDEASLDGYKRMDGRIKRKEITQKLKALFGRAKAFENKKQYRQAIAVYKEVLVVEAVNKKAPQQINNLEVLIKKLQEEASLRRVARQLLDSGNDLRKQRKYSEAIDQYENGKNTLAKYTDWDNLIKKTTTIQQDEIKKKQQKRFNAILKEYESGLKYSASEEFQKAVAAFEKVIDLTTKLKLIDLKKQAKENLKKAKENLKRSQEEGVYPESPYYEMIESLKALGLQQFEKENYAKSRKYFSNILELFPKNRVAFEYFSVCNIKLNPNQKGAILASFIQDIKNKFNRTPREALRIAEVASKIDKYNREVKDLLGKLKNKLKPKVKNGGKVAQANKLYAKARGVATSNAKLALQWVNNCLKLDPQNFRCRILKGKLKSRNGSRVSITDLRKRYNKIPLAARRMYIAGIGSFQNGNLKRAKFFFIRALKIYPQYTKARKNLNRVNRFLR